MQEDRAAAEPAAGPFIVVERDENVIEMIVAPQSFMTRGIGKADFAVIVAIGRIVTPADLPGDLAPRQRTEEPADWSAGEYLAKAPGSARRGAVTLPFQESCARASQDAGQDEISGDDDAPAARWRNRADVNGIKGQITSILRVGASHCDVTTLTSADDGWNPR